VAGLQHDRHAARLEQTLEMVRDLAAEALLELGARRA